MSMRAWALTAWTGVVFVLATLLLVYAGDESAALRKLSASPPSTLQLLTMPLDRCQPGDLRHAVLPIAFAGLLLIYAIFGAPSSTAEKPHPRGRGNRTAENTASPADTAVSWRSCWLEMMALATIALSLASALYNETWLLSRGWILEFSAGCGWAVLLSRVIDRAGVRRILVAGSIVALCAVVMSFQFRSAHHLKEFAWPIGPVTLTAGMAALWTAVALTFLFALGPQISRRQFSPLGILWTVVVLLAVLALFAFANRRGAMLAVMAAAYFTVMVMTWRISTTKKTKLLILASIPVLAGGAILYAAAQSQSSDPRASIPVAYRWVYWKNTFAHLADAPLLGHGPDLFMSRMSSVIGRQRAEMPRVLHGTIDPEAHNEWLQAAFELGLPGALLYLAIPLLAVVLAVKTWLRPVVAVRSKSESPATPEATALLACAAGIVAVLVSEGTSVCLRRGGMNVWYWTLIGLIAGWIRSGAVSIRPSSLAPSRMIARITAITAALALGVLIVGEARGRIAHAQGCLQLDRKDPRAAESLAAAGWRLGAWQAYGARADLGDAQLAAASASAIDPAEAKSRALQAEKTLRELYEIDPAYPGAACRLAQALQLAGDLPAACDVLKQFVTTINSYDMYANYLRLSWCPLEPGDAVACIEHALRDGEWIPSAAGKAATAFESPAISTTWTPRVLAALDAVSRQESSQWANTVTPETIRLEAVRLAAAGDYASADRMQSYAVDAYSRLAQEQSPFRRSSFAEADASLMSARFMFAADPLNPTRALKQIKRAESLALDGIPQRTVANAGQNDERIGGQILPAKFPPRLSPLWRFSALLRLAAGDDIRWVQQRIEWSLPEDRRASTDVAAELGAIASELVKVYARYDESRRPRHFADLAAVAQRFGPPPAPAVPNR